jgi:hypothetical protein
MNALAVFWVCLGLLVGGCATPAQAPPTPTAIVDNAVEALPPVIVNACDWDSPIYLDKKDVLTDGTAVQIDMHNSQGARRCGWRPKK